MTEWTGTFSGQLRTMSDDELLETYRADDLEEEAVDARREEFERRGSAI